VRIPKRLAWLFWEADRTRIDVERHATSIIPRVLEGGRLEDVTWLLKTYGRRRIHRFLRDVGHPELTPRTLAFWRCVFHAKDEPWADPRASRPLSAAPWIS
jgi:hypothetical protein